MGLKYSVIIPYNNDSDFESSRFKNTKIIGYGNIYKITGNNSYIKNILRNSMNEFYIIGETRFPFFKNKVEIYTDLSGRELKTLLNKNGVVSKVKDMYYYNCSPNTKIFIYDTNSQTKFYDYRYDSLFGFYKYEKYDIYILN